MSRALAVTHGSSRTVTGPLRRRFAREMGRRTQFAVGLEKIHRDFGNGVEPVDFESAIACVTVVASLPALASSTQWDNNTADQPGIGHWLIIGPNHLTPHRHAPCSTTLTCRSGLPGFGSQAMKALE